MRLLFLAVSPIMLVGATEKADVESAAAVQGLEFDNPAFQIPVRPWTGLPIPDAQERCADQIRQARAELGLPAIEKSPADPDDAMMIWAVDHRRNGCGVLVPVGRPDDIRPVPESDGTASMMPAQSD